VSRSLRILAYAINGRGMGHLVRQLAILRQVRRLCALADVQAECWVLTSSEADTLARREGFPALKIPSKAMLRDGGLDPHAFLATIRSTVLQAVSSLRPDLLLVDTFPSGSVGELIPVLELVPHRVLVARQVRPEVAGEEAFQAMLPLYPQQIVPDERGTGPILIREAEELLSRDQARAELGITGERAVYLSLGGGGDLAAAGTLPRLSQELRARGWHVVVGAGPLYQGPELRGPGLTWLSRYVPLELLPGVDAAVSAAGYNSFHELMFAGIPTVFLPQPRIADDQHARAARAVDAGAGRLAPTVEAVAALLEDPGSPAAARALVPRNGARVAARQALRGLLSETALDAADRALTPTLLTGLRHLRAPGAVPGDELRGVSDLVRSLGPDGLGRFVSLCQERALPMQPAVHLARSLARKFPAAEGPELLAACELLLPAWARFDDWMGAISLVRALPTQRSLSLPAFSRQLTRWLAQEQDLFDALRRFSRLEEGGARPVSEVLTILCQQAEA